MFLLTTAIPPQKLTISRVIALTVPHAIQIVQDILAMVIIIGMTVVTIDGINMKYR